MQDKADDSAKKDDEDKPGALIEGNKANLRYPVNIIPPTSAGEWVDRDWWLLQAIWDPYTNFM